MRCHIEMGKQVVEFEYENHGDGVLSLISTEGNGKHMQQSKAAKVRHWNTRTGQVERYVAEADRK